MKTLSTLIDALASVPADKAEGAAWCLSEQARAALLAEVEGLPGQKPYDVETNTLLGLPILPTGTSIYQPLGGWALVSKAHADFILGTKR